ncbi:DUF6443 domain-containing protein [Chryseobacterium sp. ON_d1]|uniref:DUF6443 domain-containing protein n=1 Tax=Chryseobacterium sp. ON_d1 TaxID=2583211 RepID=UPI00115A0858|nr:DUF6443 domain-containing protein [Chryseobacterium sp. ON_d1]GEJ45440.1 hypothetical protein CRS_20480 [Chryseobacterium sp. ON_d1]
MKKIIILLNLLVTGFTYAQTNFTTTENYIYEKSCLTEDCSKKTESVQYFDGLGRAKQTIAIKATPAGKDITVPVEYDAYGRQIKSYLPVPQSGTQNGALYANPLSNASSLYGSEKIYAEKVLEPSPLGRALQQKQIGNDWNGHPVQFSYAANTAAEAVKKYTVVTSWTEGRTNSELSLSGTYPENTLYKSTVTDEDGNITIQYKNKKGQTVLTRKKDGTQNADTYYVYNEYGRLAYTLPPLASASALTLEMVDNLCYQYRYDGWNRLVEKKIPGKGWEFMIYDKQDRLVGARDAVLSAKGQWLYTKYDQFGRVAITGICTGGERYQEQDIVNGYGSNNVNRINTPFFERQGMNVYYNNPDTTYPNASKWVALLSLNYYDSYPSYSFNPVFPSAIMGKAPLSDNSTANAVSTKSLPVMNFVKNIEDDNWTKNYVYYDSKGRVIGTHSINHLGGYTKTESELDFIGAPQKSSVYHIRKDGEPGITIKQRYTYDDQNRLLQHYHQIDDKPEQLLSENTYNELSQLTNKKVGNNLQSIDYTYNIRGWLSGINKNQMTSADLGGKLFSYQIKYNQKDGVDNPDPVQFAGKNVIPKYSGNITEVDWRAVETVGVNPSLTPKRYGYAYDSLNRITAGYYQNPNNPYSKENTESLQYDLNGNITSLYRTSVFNTGNNTATVIDNLTYSYKGNQAIRIKDNSNNNTGYEGTAGYPIEHDANGNMKNMQDKQISDIKYNHLNLPQEMSLDFGTSGTVINTRYRADGAKLEKTAVNSVAGYNTVTTTTEKTEYLDGFQYYKKEIITSGGDPGGGGIEMMTARAMEPQAYSLENKTVNPATAKTPDLQFFPTAEGFYDYQKDQYIYQYKDNLGNVRISYGRNSTGALEIVDNNDYYPLGMNHLKSGTAFFGQGSYKKHKYNGKELQETGMYSYGWRDYMPDVGRWNGIDQLAEAYSSTSTYAYVANNPISNTDPDGRWINEDGSIRPSTTFDYMPGSYKPMYSFSTSTGMSYNSAGGGGGGYTPFGKTQAYADLMDAWRNGAEFSLKVNNGYMSWWTGGVEGNANTAQEMIAHMMKLVGDGNSLFNTIDFSQTTSNTTWWVNTAIGAASTANVPRTGVFKYNDLWHQTKTRGTSFRWQNRWGNSGAKYWRGQQVKGFQGARSLGTKLTAVGGALLVADVAMSGELKTSHLINGAMLTISMSGVGSIVAGAWFVADMGTMGVNYLINGEAKGLGDMIDEATGGPLVEMYDGLY